MRYKILKLQIKKTKIPESNIPEHSVGKIDKNPQNMVQRTESNQIALLVVFAETSDTHVESHPLNNNISLIK